jgi:hypothetical protein
MMIGTFRTVKALLSAAIIFTVVVPLASSSAAPNYHSVHVAGGDMEIEIAPGDLHVTEDQILEWVHWAATSVAGYFGKFPVSHTTIAIRPFNGSGVRNGRTFGRNGGEIFISLGDQTKLPKLRQDWMMTHEFVHLAFPSVPESHHWIEEGLATYVEPIARMRAGYLTPEQVWGDFIRDMPQGFPQKGDRGLDNTHSWGRTYWGGAIFCLLADIEIRKRSNNKKGLEDALRGILHEGGNITQDWDLLQALRVGDKATGVPVLENLYRAMKDSPTNTDLESLWKKLGVENHNGRVIFNDDAPLASVRQAITKGGAF